MTIAAARSHLAATLVFAASLVLIAAQAPLWCVGLALAASAWRVAVATGRLPELQLRKGMRFGFGALTALLVFAVLMSFRTLNGLAAGTALLTLMGALKLIESRTRRDDGIVIGVALFMLLAAALANQALWRLPLYLLCVWGAGAAMALIAHSGSSLPVRGALRLSARALLMALPLAVACFIFFPRMAGQFWALETSQTATTGLSDELSPGAIDRLVGEYDPVFRVRFLDATPPPEARYWRGPVLNAFDGYTWRRRQLEDQGTPLELLGESVRQRVTLEPSNRRWLFALDTVARAPRAGIRMTSDRQLLAFEPVVDAVTYEVSSHLRTVATGELTARDRRFQTLLPPDRNPRALALGREMRASVGSDAEFTRVALDWFRNNGLLYSLEPEPTSLDSVDSVLFDTKRGFCGHFASSYATLMRAAGVPARVVTGYLGGEYNSIGDYWIVRQSDAHAWTEVWLDDGGWTRIDPTAVVAPERLRMGAYDVLPASQVGAGAALWRNAWLSRVARLWDGTNQWWRERVLDFNLTAQFNFLRALGIDSPDWEHLGWAFALGLITWIAWISVTLRRSVARRKPDRIGRAWLKATRKLARVAPAREAAEGPLAYATRIAVVRPDLAEQVHGIAARYGALRYGRETAREGIEELEREVRRLAV